MSFIFKTNIMQNTQKLNKSTIARMRCNSSHFLTLMAGIRSFVFPEQFYRAMLRSNLNIYGDKLKNIVKNDSYLKRLQSLAVYNYSLIIYTRKHKNARKMSTFTGILSGERKRYRFLSNFLFIPIVNTFPIAAELAFNYYDDFSPSKKFESIIQEKINSYGIDNDSCQKFFMEVVNSVEPSQKWARRMVSLSSELYGENRIYMDLFSIYIAYIIYRIYDCNMSDVLKYTYKKSPLELALDLYKNRKNIESYLNLIQLHSQQ